MCELMGLSFATPISADFSIREFARRGEGNADGWGLAWYPDQSLAIVKEPLRWRESLHTVFLESYHQLRSCLYIAHVRHRTTGGEPNHADTHPFARELAGREYCFAHNGTIRAPQEELTLRRFHPIGATDSERVFCHLLDALALGDGQLSAPPSWQWLHRKLAALNRHGLLNCLLSDGQRLFCYHDAAGWKGLTFRRMYIRDHKSHHFEDATVSIDLEGKSINHGIAVATHPLSAKGWHPFQAGELLVLEEGAVRFSSHRDHRNIG